MKRLTLLLVAFVAACSTVQVTGPLVGPDASISGPCATAPIIECEAGPPGAPGCATEPGDGGTFQSQIPTGKSYPLGCIVDFPYAQPLKETGECTLKSQCTCTSPQVTDGGSAWTCVQ